MQTWYPLVLRYKRVIKGTKFCVEVNLPGTEDTVINQAVPPGSGIALSRVEACISPKRLGCASGGLRSRMYIFNKK